MPYKWSIIGLVTILCQTGCRKADTGDHVMVQFSISHKVNGTAVVADTIRYLNAAGNSYSVKRLQYFISGIGFIKSDKSVYELGVVHLVDMNDTGSLRFTGGVVPKDNYTGIRLHIGLVPEVNEHGRIGHSVGVSGMFWPDIMGGGYHFLKLEGHFLDAQDVIRGYALHLGTDSCLVTVVLDGNPVSESALSEILLEMDVAEWFQNPNTYDLNDGNYSMGEGDLMHRIAENGATCVKWVRP